MQLLSRELLKSNIEKIAEYDLLQEKVFGSAYCVVQEEKVVYKDCFGYSSVDGAKPVTEDTIFRLASMTKPITAMAILVLVERGLLSLSDPVRKYLPDFSDIPVISWADSRTFTDEGKAKTDVTITHLLTHTSGFGSDESKVLRMTSEDKSTIDKSIQYFLAAGLDFQPGTKQQYSATAAFDVLVKIIETITGTDYQEFLKTEIFVPCGMKNTTFIPTKEQWDAMIEMHNRVDGKSVIRRMGDNCIFGDYPCTHYLGGAGLVSTLSDYTKFAQMLLKDGKTETSRLISKETFQLFGTPFVTKELMPGNERWGLGVRVIVDSSYPHLSVGTFGWSGAYGSHFWVDPKNRIAAVFMKNSVFDGGAGNESAKNFEKAVAESLKR